MEEKNSTNYFLNPKYENRVPDDPIKHSNIRELAFQFFSILFIGLGVTYIYWRWTNSLNYKALWFAIPLVLAETLSFIGSILMIINCWSNKDPKKQKIVHYTHQISTEKKKKEKKPISIDVFIATFNEDLELVKHTILDAKKMTYPFEDVIIKIYLLDDGKRDGTDSTNQNFKQLAENQGIYYITRDNNIGHKAGNLNNAFNQTSGDFIVILDADTRPFPKFCENTLGYFRNKKLAWVQTPQWFYDLTEPILVKDYLKSYLGKTGYFIGSIFGKMKTGKDIFGNDPKQFYEIILKSRNNYNSAFSCGAGSVYRREALNIHSENKFINKVKQIIDNESIRYNYNSKETEIRKKKIEKEIEKEAFVLHASEDIYTSLLLHSEGWQSIQHPNVECKMLSPQDLDGWVKQRTRYATGSLDIGLGKDSPLFLRGLSFGQRLSYFTTVYSYFSPLWLITFLVSPAIFFFSHTPPIIAFNFDFFIRFLPFMILNTLIVAIAQWGISSKRPEQYYVSSFWLFLKSLISVLMKADIKFNVTSKEVRNAQNFKYIIPHLTILIATLIGLIYNTQLVLNNTHPSFSAYFANCIWTIFNFYQLSAFIRAGLWTNSQAN